MSGPKTSTVKRLFAESGNLCAFPDCSTRLVDINGTVLGEICHIKGRRKGSERYDPGQSEADRHGFDNLILLCRDHHKVIDAQSATFTFDLLQRMKAMHVNRHVRAEQDQDELYAAMLIAAGRTITIEANSGGVAIDSPGAVVAGTVNIKTTKSAVRVNAPPGTIGADHELSRYVSYLIERYNRFASADRTRSKKFHPGVVSRKLTEAFGARWQLLPGTDFQLVCQHLQQKIEGTIIGRQRKASGESSFSTFEEYLSQHARA